MGNKYTIGVDYGTQSGRAVLLIWLTGGNSGSCYALPASCHR